MARRKYYVIIQQLLSEFNVLEKIESIKEKIIRNNNAFILSGWLPKNQKDKLSKQLSKVSKNFIISFKEVHEIGEDITPPTKLKNPKWFKPFENLVKMYGIPSYNELDPTMFLSISYLIMFGAMFGDIGQGLVFLIFGAILEKRKIGLFFAQLLNRLGVSSIFFGIIYGSVFGNEELIPWGIKSIFGEKA